MSKWYILHTSSGSEKKVKRLLEEQISKHNMSEYFDEIFVPVIQVPEIKKGKKVLAEKKFMPGYILIKMNMTDDSWHLVKSVPKIGSFLGGKMTPKPLAETEVNSILAQIASEVHTVSTNLYEIGDKIQIIDGPFDAFTGVVEKVDSEAEKLKVMVSIFGKDTPIELMFSQVKKD